MKNSWIHSYRKFVKPSGEFDKGLLIPWNELLNYHKGPFTNYVDKILAFLTTYHPVLTFSMVWTSLVWTLTNSGHFWTTYLPILPCKHSLWTTPRTENKNWNAILPMITNKPDMSRLLLHISVTDNNYLIVIFICLEKKNGRQLFPGLISTSRIVTTNWNGANSLRILRKTSNCSKWFLI